MITLDLIEQADVATGPASALLAAGVATAASLVRPENRDDWLDVVSDTQVMINVLTAIQDHAIGEAARRESVWADDGTLDERIHLPGRVTIDAADLVAPRIGATHAHAQRRVEAAVRLGFALAPLPAEVRGHQPAPNGLHDVRAARLDGRLDAYRAGVLADELEEAPAEVADAVISALDPHLTDDATALRRRCRRLVSRISPDLLRRRAVRARASTGLRRWVSEPGVDAWYGTFPSEDAAAAWAAIDARAQQLVAEGTCTSVEQARGRALTDLVTEHATVDVRVVLTVPADTGTGEPSTRHGEPTLASSSSAAGNGALVEVQGARPCEPLLVSRHWLEQRMAGTLTQSAACAPTTGSRVDPAGLLATGAYRPGPALIALVKQRDGRCRFPGCSVAARFCDLDHVRPWPTGPTTDTNLLTLCRRHHRVKQRPGWLVRLDPDGTAHWTDPTGRTRTTAPLDALDALVL